MNFAASSTRSRDLCGRLDAGVDRIGDADEDATVAGGVRAQDLRAPARDPSRSPAGRRSCRRATEERRQELPRSRRRRCVSSPGRRRGRCGRRSRFAPSAVNSAEHPVVQATKESSRPLEGSSLSDRRASVKSIWHRRSGGSRQPPDVGRRLANEVLEELLARVVADAVLRIEQESAEAAMTACFIGGWSRCAQRPGSSGRRRVAEGPGREDRELPLVTVRETDGDSAAREVRRPWTG